MKGAGIVAFAFGVPHTLDANTLIAALAVSESRRLDGDLPVFTQLDIQFAPELNIPVTRCTEEPEYPPPTMRICREAVYWATRERINVLIIVAAGPHVWRCERDLEEAIRDAKARIVIHVCKNIFRPQYRERWFSPESTQPRARSFWAFWPWEIVLRLMPMFLYKRVGS